jgi:hypothetical protein
MRHDEDIQTFRNIPRYCFLISDERILSSTRMGGSRTTPSLGTDIPVVERKRMGVHVDNFQADQCGSWLVPEIGFPLHSKPGTTQPQHKGTPKAKYFRGKSEADTNQTHAKSPGQDTSAILLQSHDSIGFYWEGVAHKSQPFWRNCSAGRQETVETQRDRVWQQPFL